MRSGERRTAPRIVAAGILAVGLASAAVASRGVPAADVGPGAEDPITTATPPESSEVAREPVRRGVDFLLQAQRGDGSWGSAESARPSEVLADVPGSHHAFRVGTTALCVLALHRSPLRREECRQAAERGLRYLLDHCLVKRPNGMELYNVWAFGYSLQVFGEMLDTVQEAALRERLLDTSRALVAKLGIYQTPDGGWGYYDFEVGAYRPSDTSMSFTTATILLSLRDIERKGVPVPRPMVDGAIRSLRRCRMENGAYLYGPYAKYRPDAGFNKLKGSIGRTQACNLALRAHGENVTEDDLRRGVESFFQHHRFLDLGRARPMPHESWYSTSGYYFYYGHYHAGRVIDLLPEPQRSKWRAQLEKLLVERQEPDGSWWDFPLYSYHKPYGTAYALLTLIR